MRISTFWSYILWFIGLSTFTYFGWTIDVGPNENMWFALEIIGRPMSVGLLFAYSVLLTDSLRDIVAFKYRIIEDWRFEAQVQTSFYLFIPHWVAVDTDGHSYETQNVFGATGLGFYETDVRYENEKKALKAIENHKKEVIRKREEFFKRPEKDEKKITYI